MLATCGISECIEEKDKIFAIRKLYAGLARNDLEVNYRLLMA